MSHDRPLDLRIQDALDAQPTASEPCFDVMEVFAWRDEAARLREVLDAVREGCEEVSDRRRMPRFPVADDTRIIEVVLNTSGSGLQALRGVLRGEVGERNA